ncbi:hypothetical protein GQX74_011798 [Glossina fuscipes]|nr:hypothetical protein GQX74_011798 [Glossina fuscipes]
MFHAKNIPDNMHKYQQLLLLIISCISVGILLMNKTENNRLKDVLHVINFFGRKDAASPLRQYQQLISLSGQHFHTYAAYWKRYELVGGGEAVIIVVGRRGAILNFKCSVNYEANKLSKGKFRFQRLTKEEKEGLSEYTRYRFYCGIAKDFGRPKSVMFTVVTYAGSTLARQNCRSEVHILLSDDRGTSKSQMLQCMYNLVLRSLYNSGQASESTTIIERISVIAATLRHSQRPKEILFNYGDRHFMLFEHLKPNFGEKMQVVEQQEQQQHISLNPNIAKIYVY